MVWVVADTHISIQMVGNARYVKGFLQCGDQFTGSLSGMQIGIVSQRDGKSPLSNMVGCVFGAHGLPDAQTNVAHDIISLRRTKRPQDKVYTLDVDNQQYDRDIPRLKNRR